MSEQPIDAVDASMTTQPFPKAADVSMITQADVSADVLNIVQTTIPATTEGTNAFDDVPPMSQHSEDQDAIMETQKVASKDQA